MKSPEKQKLQFSKIFLLFCFLFSLIFASCNFFNFGGDLKELTASALTIDYTFYENESLESKHEDCNFMIGYNVLSSAFPQYTQDDYLLVGWRFLKYTNDKKSIPDNINYDEYQMVQSLCVEPDPMTFYGVWAKKCYVNFVTNCDTEFETAVVPQGYKLESLPKYFNMVKEKHAFRGWYTDPDFTEPFDFNNIIASDITLYAKWVLQITVTLYQNDGTDRNQKHVYDYGTRFWIHYPDYQRPEGKGFVGWATSADSSTPAYYFGEEINSLSEDVNLYAIWSTDLVTLTYHRNEGNDATIVETFGRGAKFQLGQIIHNSEYEDKRCWTRNISEEWTAQGQAIQTFSLNPAATMNNAGYYYWQTITLDISIDVYCIWGAKVYNVNYYINNSSNGGLTSFYWETVNWGEKTSGPSQSPGGNFVGWCLRINNEISPTIFDFDKVFNEQNLGTESSHIEFIARFQ